MTTAKNNIVIDPPIGPKKSIFIMVTVIGCVAILWPKVLQPMLFGGGIPSKNMINDDGVVKYKKSNYFKGCCEVILDHDKFANVSLALSQPGFRKTLNILTGENSIRQERPPQYRPDNIHPAMHERGRAIPHTNTVPIISGKLNTKQSSKTHIVDGRPGPMPGIRPPMGAGVHQATQKGSSMGFIMPLYTIGIIIFFVYTIMRLLFKNKPPANTPIYAESVKSDPKFKNQVFNENNRITKKNGTTTATTKLGWDEHSTSTHICEAINSFLRSKDQYCNKNVPNSSIDLELEIQLRETEKLLEVSLLKKKLRETEKAMDELRAQMEEIPRAKGLIDDADAQLNRRKNVMKLSKDKPALENEEIYANGISNIEHVEQIDEEMKKEKQIAKNTIGEFIKNEQNSKEKQLEKNLERKKRDISGDRTVKVLGMEMTASCEGGQKWGRPPTPVLSSTSHQHIYEDELPPEPQSIFLEGSLPHESQILVADSETKTEELYDTENVDNDTEEPAVVLSSKMTLSLINMDPIEAANENNIDEEELISEEEVEEEEEEEEEEDDVAVVDEESVEEVELEPLPLLHDDENNKIEILHKDN